MSWIAQGPENGNVLFDGNLDTSMRGISQKDAWAELRFEFDNPVNLSGIRLLSRDNQYPWHCEIAVKTERETEWRTALPKTPCHGIFLVGGSSSA